MTATGLTPLRLLLAAGLTTLVLAAPASGTIPAGNLVTNPGAEAPEAPVSDTGVAAPTGWSTSGNLTVMAYGRNGFPPTGVSSTIGGGTNFFAGGPNTPSSLATQIVDVAQAGTEIDAGKVDADLSAYLGGIAGQGDSATVTARFATSVFNPASTGPPLTIGPVTAADRGNATTLLARSASARVPAGTRAIQITVTTTRTDGAYDDGYADNVSVVLHDNTPPPPPPSPPPPSPPPPGGTGTGSSGGSGGGPPAVGGPAAPRVTAVHPLAPLRAGETAVLAADVTGGASRLLWDLNGDGKADVGCDGSQTTLTFRPGGTAAGARTITVQAIGAGGRGDRFTQTVQLAAATGATSTADRQARAVVARGPGVTACGKASDAPAFQSAVDQGLAARIDAERCHQMTIHVGFLSGSLEATGCFYRIHRLDQVPLADRGLFTELSGALKVPARRLIGKVPQVLADATVFEARTPIIVDGATLTPKNDSSILVAPSFSKVFGSDAAFTVGGIALAEQRDFSFDTTPASGGRIPLGAFARTGGGLGTVGGFSLAGDVRVTLTPGTPEQPAGAELIAHLQLPSFLEVGGVHVQSDIRLLVTGTGQLVLDNLRIGPIDAAIGPLGVQGLQIDYTRAVEEWKGQAQLCVVVACLDAREIPGEAPPGGVLIRHGQLVRAYANLNFPDPGITLFAGVQLNRIGAGIGLGPPRFLGGARLTALGILRIDGALVVALPTAAEPFILTREENGDAFPAEFYGRPYNRVTVALGADASLKVPILSDPLALAKAYFLYEAPGYVAFGGGVSANFLDAISLSGGVDGEFNAENGRFNLSGHIRACVADVVCAGAIAYLSSVGVGGCVTISAFFGDLNVGGGIVYNPFDIKLWPFDGCRWSRFKDDHVFSARAAPTGVGGAVTVHVVPGERSQAVALDTAAGAARVRVTGPGGVSADTPAGPGLTLTRAVRIMRSERLHQTVVGLVDPKPGDYRLELLPGSPPLTKVSQATDPPPAQVRARVSGRGSTRTLTYDIAPRPGQSVTFVEVSGVARRPIGTVSGPRGSLRFTPAPGQDRRTVIAQFTLDGIRAETRTVARFSPPAASLARPTHLQVRRRGARLDVRWKAVPGATSYDVVVTAGDAQRITRARGPHASLRGAVTSAGRVSVRATAPMRVGRAASTRFRATRKARTRFGRAPRVATVFRKA
jgi:hypothetical protein